MSDILGDFSQSESLGEKVLKEAVTIWLPADAKARYDRLQAKSRRQFSKKAREALLELISIAEARVS